MVVFEDKRGFCVFRVYSKVKEIEGKELQNYRIKMVIGDIDVLQLFNGED